MRNLEKEKAFKMIAEYVRAMAETNYVDYDQDLNSGITLCYVSKLNRRTGIRSGYFGVSKCNPEDKWNALLGKYLALKRAVGGKIPKSIYENAVHG
jgi:hypothetical protein